jgi:serine/threonine-protein kinase RsbW
MSYPQEIDRTLHSDPSHCAELLRDMMEILRLDGWSKDDMFAIRMAVEEAVMNGIKHGNEENHEKIVSVLIRLTQDRFYAKITDQGKGFCPDDVPDPTAEPNLDKTSGRGVMLIKAFVDQCSYNQCGNSVELVKHRS